MANAVVADRSERTAERTDEQLVGAVRRGDDRAFEQLYARYQRRIGAYVFGMVKDHGRAEDITQEVFVSALRRMRETERPIAFKAWIYEIARNACIDAYRRARRAEEVSYDADDRLSPSDQVRLVAAGPEPDAAVDAKQELDHLCGAFGGLSDSHHEILVLRELEGRSYKDIGERMGMSRPAVESTLFRARRRLSEEYDELVSGARCLRTEAIIAAGGQRLGVREQRRLARHVSHCQPCRLLALQAGLELPAQRRRRIAERIAGLLPLPAFLRGRRGGDEATTTLGAGGNGWMAHVPSVADSIGSGWSKGAAGLAALLLAGAGAGVTGFGDSAKRDERGTGYRAADVRASAGDAAAAAPRRACRGHRAARRGHARVRRRGEGRPQRSVRRRRHGRHPHPGPVAGLAAGGCARDAVGRRARGRPRHRRDDRHRHGRPARRAGDDRHRRRRPARRAGDDRHRHGRPARRGRDGRAGRAAAPGRCPRRGAGRAAGDRAAG
jgi:RNA polymerase sigma factor (sigma-70 family)